MRNRSTRVLRNVIDREQQGITNRRNRARQVVSARIDAGINDIGHLAARVRALSPAATLDRGYAIVMAPSGVIVRSPQEVTPGDRLDIRVAGGRFAAAALETTADSDKDGRHGQED
jgi:exodeoxyribonuclease VII large subunit